MPLIPGFPGEIDDPSATVPQVILNWQYKTICRGDKSLFSRLRKHTDHPEEYVEFYGLRNHGVIDDIPKTEIIYIHSKLMIIDDRHVLCGSANINDRSMEGDRDSELCLLTSGDPTLEIEMGGESFVVVPKIHQMRKKLLAEHFSLQQ